MHIPDGFVDGPTSGGALVLAGAGVGLGLRKAGATLEERQVPLCGLVSAFVFAAQMVNFPVAAGTSGHLLGGALAAVLVGPWAGVVCMAVVITVQALLFADGGLSALGLNVVNMALVATLGGYVVFVVVRAVLPRTKAAIGIAAGVAAGISAVLASAAFTLEYALGGTGNASVRAVFGAMVGVHTLIGIGEGLITGLTVGAVLATRPDLVRGAGSLSATRSTRRLLPAHIPNS